MDCSKRYMKKKVAILSVTDLRHITMIQIYTDYFFKKGIVYDIICSDRYGTGTLQYDDARVFSVQIPDHDAGKLDKLAGYLFFYKFAKKIIESQNYGLVVLWNERTAALFSDFIIKSKIPYCVNIRDIWNPMLPVVRNRLRAAVRFSMFSTWCATKGLQLLPEGNYIVVLNQNIKAVKQAKKNTGLRKKNEPIRIGVVGNIRHIKESKALMCAVNGDDRYILQFFGSGASKLKKYAERIGMTNIEAEDSFTFDETGEYLNRIDVINVYTGFGKNRINESLYIPIRFGYSTGLYKPAIVSPNTYLSKLARDLNVGYTVDTIDNFADDFYSWYYSLDFGSFRNKCDVMNNRFSRSIREFEEMCDKMVYPILVENNE